MFRKICKIGSMYKNSYKKLYKITGGSQKKSDCMSNTYSLKRVIGLCVGTSEERRTDYSGIITEFCDYYFRILFGISCENFLFNECLDW